MPSKTEKDLWVELSIREIHKQACFAIIAFGHINPKAMAANDMAFSSIHPFLSHCAMASKMLKARDGGNPQKTIGSVLNIPNGSLIHQRQLRNDFEHYEKELKRWIRQIGIGRSIGDYNIGQKSKFQISNMVFVRHYDPSNNTFTFVDDDFDLGALLKEVTGIKGIANNWIKEMEAGIISPPFI